MNDFFNGVQFSYSYEPVTDHIFLHDTGYTTCKFLHGEDALLFQQEIALLAELPEPDSRTETEKIIRLLL